MSANVAGLIEELRKVTGNPQSGLPEELFVFTSQITPLVNVDLLIRDENKGVLLTWRDDGHYRAGWHVPGGIIRFKETFDDRIRYVAKHELGASVTHDDEPVAINQIIHPSNKTRGHFISLLFACRLATQPDESLVAQKKPEHGQWRWHKRSPENLIAVHGIYRPFFN